jgi:Tfp pilus assembly protein PilV
MQGIPRRRDPWARPRLRDEAGFALVEVMVSAVLLIVLSLATLKVLDKSQETGANNRARGVAAQLAQSDQDKIRQLPISALAGGYYNKQPVDVGGLRYEVESKASWVQDSGGPVTCSTTGTIAYLQTSTSVTWAGMGPIKPVTSDAIVDPGVAALGAKKGALTVLLSKADGTGTEGVTVTVAGMSAVTDANGCAVIGNLDAGPQTLTYSDNRFVDKDGVQAISKPVTIGAGTISQTTGIYDFPGMIDMSVVDDPNVPGTPTWDKVSVDHAQRSTPTLLSLDWDPDGVTTATVFPFSSPYKAFVGNCYGNDPANTLYGGDAQGTQVGPGVTKPLALTMPSATVTVNNAAVSTSNRNGQTVVRVLPETSAPYASMTGCSVPGYQWSVNAGTANNPDVKLQLPYGIWRVCADYKYSNNRWAHKVTVAGSSGTDKPLALTPSAATGTYATRTSTTLTMPSSSTSSNSTLPACT